MCVLILDGVVILMLSWKPERIQTAACSVSVVSDSLLQSKWYALVKNTI